MKVQLQTTATALLAGALFAPLTPAQARGSFGNTHDALMAPARRHIPLDSGSAFSKRAHPYVLSRHQQQRRGSAAQTFTEQQDNLADGTATAEQGCKLWVQPASGDSCYSVIDLGDGLALEEFFDLNPSLEKECQQLQVNKSYCIAKDGEHNDAESTASSSSQNQDKGSAQVKKVQQAAQVQQAQTAAPASTQAAAASSQSSSWSSSSEDSGSSSLGDGLIAGTQGLLQLWDDTCGSADATAETTDVSGPNGNINFLNCGLNANGWTAPALHINQVKYKGLSEVQDDSLFSACAPYFDLFNQHGAEHGVPPIFLASIAMQESSCNPSATGGGGEAGLMQITSDKCGNAPGGNCHDPAYNIATGSAYFKDRLDSYNGNVLLALGGYNGWSAGMTYSSATAAANSGCCKCQNNLDYLHGVLNCLAQGIGNDKCKHYKNLEVCG